MEVDLETDSEPIVGQGTSSDLLHRTFLHTTISGKDERQDSGNCESGFHSGGLLSGDSVLDEGRCISALSEDLEASLPNCGLEKRVGLLSIDEGVGSLNSSEYSREFLKPESEAKPSETHRVNGCFEQDEEGDTFIHLATIHLMSDYAEHLVRSVKDPKVLNLQNNYLQTALHLSVITNQPHLTRLYQVAGCSVDIRDHKGNTPLHIGAKYGFTETVRHLLTPVTYEERTKLLYPTPYCKIPQNLEARNYDGQTPVHLAAEGGHIETLEILIHNGADINTRDGKSGRSILHYAAEMENIALLLFLLKQPSLNIDAYTYSQLTPIMLAKGRGHLQIVEALKEQGATYFSDESDEDEMMEDNFDDIQINGQPALHT